MIKNNFKDIIIDIKESESYENLNNWEERGLVPSSQAIILLLRKATNDFINEIEKIHEANESLEIKLEKVSNLVDEIPWFEFDTEEKEFLADVLAPAIEVLGLNPWEIF